MWTTTTEKPLMQRIWEEKTGLLRQVSLLAPVRMLANSTNLLLFIVLINMIMMMNIEVTIIVITI